MDLQTGTSSVYLITDKYYKSTSFRNGSETFVSVYHDESKRIYDSDPERNYCAYRDARKPDGLPMRTKVFRDSISTIAGLKCFMVENRYSEHTSKTYYSSFLKINPESFKDHLADRWYQKIKEVDGALNLKTVTYYDDYIKVEEVVKIIPRDVSKNEFNLPANKPVYASNNTLDKPVLVKPPGQHVIDCYRDQLMTTPSPFGGTRSYTSYVRFVVTSEGKVESINPVRRDEHELYKIAMNIVSTCGLEFIPGGIAGEKVSAEVYFPVEFRL
jgi:hypothetical protein